ncbi:alpha/beta hydrolase family protein [Nocardia mexicana]|uniref:Secretory lipase n=1 Tax=Nocardia mexicana TaxID=279262 RepID=A0A370H7D9_9NOCA|nr:alpha/beta fold hydrolase [Nocardia mexicana]RDI52134.1 secretory lipase [Nocardia mexicana]
MKARNWIAAAAVSIATIAAAGATATHVGAAEPGSVTAATDLADYQWIPGAASAKRAVYWTQTSQDRPALSSGALFVPHGSPPAGGWPVVAWEHGTVGRADACAPSRTDFTMYRDYIGTLLARGYAVAATDYPGLGTPGDHPYLDGRAAAYSAVDMVRAARTIDASLSPRWVAVGHSQGGHAALFTASVATAYAPELDYRGAAALAPASGIVDRMLPLGGPGVPEPDARMKTALGYLLGGLHTARPNFDPTDYLTPVGRRVVADGDRLCSDDMTARLEHVQVADMLGKPLSDGEFEQVARPVLDVPTTGYDHPLMIFQGTDDIDVPASGVSKQAAVLRADGVRLDLRRYPGVGHMQVLEASADDVDSFLRQLLR